MPSSKSCSVVGCERPFKQYGYCAMHYKRVWKTGEVGPVGENRKTAKPPKTCDVDGCERLTRSHRAPFCEMHRMRAANGVDLAAPLLKTPNAGMTCSVDGCDRPAATRQLCKGHYARMLNTGDTGPAEFFEAKYAPFVRHDGYVSAYANGEWDLQHRQVMERTLGRKLLPGETPHHLNGQRSDNRPENLELWSRSQPAGQRVSDKLAWCAEMVRQYPELAANYGLGFFEKKYAFCEIFGAYVEEEKLGAK